MLTGSCPQVVKKWRKNDPEMKMLTGNCLTVVKQWRKSRPGDEKVEGTCLKYCSFFVQKHVFYFL